MTTRFPLPPYVHLPGQNPRHDPSVFAAVKAATPAETRSEQAALNPAWRHGLDLLAAGYFWECHEVLEPVWLNAAPNSRPRRMAQAVIQLANAGLKQRVGKPKAAARLSRIVIDLARDLGDDHVMAVSPGAIIWLAEGIERHEDVGSLNWGLIAID